MNVPDDVREAMARAFSDKRTPYISRRNKSYDDGRIYEVIRMDNPDWRDVITDDQTVMGRFPNSQEADALCAKLEAEFHADAALSALEAAGFEVNRKGALEALEPFAREAASWDSGDEDVTPRYDDAFPIDRFREGRLVVGDLRRARAMLTASRHKEKQDG